MFQSPLKSSVTSVGFGSSPVSLKTLTSSYKTLTDILGKPVQKFSVFIKVILYMIERFIFLDDSKVILSCKTQTCSIKIFI